MARLVNRCEDRFDDADDANVFVGIRVPSEFPMAFTGRRFGKKPGRLQVIGPDPLLVRHDGDELFDRIDMILFANERIVWAAVDGDLQRDIHLTSL